MAVRVNNICQCEISEFGPLPMEIELREHEGQLCSPVPALLSSPRL